MGTNSSADRLTKENLDPKQGDVERHPVSKHTLIALLAPLYSHPNKVYFTICLKTDNKVFPHGSLLLPLPVKKISTQKHMSSVQSPLLFLSSPLLIYGFFKLTVHMHLSSSCCISPLLFSHIFSKAFAAAGEAPACQRGSGSFRVTH